VPEGKVRVGTGIERLTNKEQLSSTNFKKSNDSWQSSFSSGKSAEKKYQRTETFVS
jgi:hypothetical protein